MLLLMHCCCWCADAADALMLLLLLLRWCYWSADAANALLLLRWCCCECTDADAADAADVLMLLLLLWCCWCTDALMLLRESELVYEPTLMGAPDHLSFAQLYNVLFWQFLKCWQFENLLKLLMNFTIFDNVEIFLTIWTIFNIFDNTLPFLTVWPILNFFLTIWDN